MPPCKRVGLGILMLICFPIVAVLGLVLVPICMAVCAAIAALIGSCVIAANVYCDQNCCLCLIIFVLTLPITICVAAFGVGLFVLAKGLQLYFESMRNYLFTVKVLICGPTDPQPEAFGLPELQDEL